MIMAVAAGGTTAVTIAMWARVYTIQFTLASSACTFPQLHSLGMRQTHVVIAT